MGPSHLQLLQQLCRGARGPPRGRAILGVQPGVELCQGLANGVSFFLELRSVGGQMQSLEHCSTHQPCKPVKRKLAKPKLSLVPHTIGLSTRAVGPFNWGALEVGHFWFTELNFL